MHALVWHNTLLGVAMALTQSNQAVVVGPQLSEASSKLGAFFRYPQECLAGRMLDPRPLCSHA